jgi:hypothetical protein
MNRKTKAPTVLVFWRGQRTADALGAATNAPQVEDITLLCMVADRHEVGGDAT